jgi:DNA-binding NarL/FixJ family response regulator
MSQDRVLIVASHPLIRGIVRLACDGIDGAVIVGEAATSDEARAAVAAVDLDLLVLDVDLPERDGLSILREVHSADARSRATPRSLVLSERDDGGFVLETFRLGATGYLTKSDGLRGLTTALRGVLAGETVLPPHLERDVVAALPRFAETARDTAMLESVLTEREREVLALLATGLTVQQVGRRLGISPRTVETHVTKLYRKLGVRGRLQAISRAAALGLIRLD